MNLSTLSSRLCGSVFLVLCVSAAALSAQIGREYSFETTNSTYSSITGTQAISGTTTSTYGTFDERRTAGAFPIGFDFIFDCTTYTQFTVATGGYMILGTTTYGTTTNDLDGSAAYPVIAPFWDHQHMYDGNCNPSISPTIGVYYQTTGTAPNRVLTVEWRAQLNSSGTYYWFGCTGGPLVRYTARLYEGSNRIEFHYGYLYSGLTTSASIGVAAGSNEFLSITPGSGTASSTSANDNVNLTSNGIQQGTIYRLTPNRLLVDGRTGTGNEGVTDPKDGDTLLANVLDRIGESNSYTPMDLSRSCASPDISVQMSITGPDAASYSFATTGNQSYNTTVTGAGVRPSITFRPLSGGRHDATLTVQSAGSITSYQLYADAEPRIMWIGNVADGGTQNVLDGDTLLKDIQVIFGNSRTFRPLTLRNILNPGDAPPASITYELFDLTGSYSIDMTGDAIDGGETSTLAITYNAVNGVGTEEALLTVEVDGDRRTYLLRAFASAPGGHLIIDGDIVDSTSQLYISREACVGEGIVSYEVTAVNTGSGDFIIEGFEAYATTTEIGQGTPPYPILRDDQGALVPMTDYFVSNAPGAAPRTAGGGFSELVIPEGGTSTFWINFVPEISGKRFARIYFRTNGFNLNDRSVEGVVTRGLVSASAFARGLGSGLAGDAEGVRPTAIIFPRTDVRESRTTTAWIYNSGDCDLKIDRSALRFESGDVDEFELVEVLPNTMVSGTNWVIPPGSGDSIVIRFSPQTYGSRLATLRLETNDSSLGGNGVIARGDFYWDVYGPGSVGLEARDLRLPPAVIGGEGSRGSVLLENTSSGVIEITAIDINDGNGEILPDPADPWPSLPHRLQPGEQLRLAVLLSPDPAGTPGERNATMEVTIREGDAATAAISGYAGTRTLSVNPPNLFVGISIGVGEIARAYVGVINTGTLPVRLDNPMISGTNPSNYEVVPLRRRVLEPGAIEILEVVFSPTAPGTSSAELSIGSNATNGAQIVTLGGEAAGTISPNDPSRSIHQQNIPALPGRPGTTRRAEIDFQ